MKGTGMRARIGIIAAALLALAGCAGPTAQNPSPISGVRSGGEQRAGDQAHPQILAQFGGAYQGPVSDYVRGIGRRIAANTEQPQGPWTFTVLDSPIVNAFALPGGYVYVTRGLVALAGDEAQLAGVIGHEMGHVVAAHSTQRNERATIAQIGVLAAVLGGAALGLEGSALEALGQGAGALAQGTVASYSRAQEIEADRLGVAYLGRTGYDPGAQADFLRAMQAQDALSARLAGGAYDPNRVDFFATHPATGLRIEAAEAAAGAGGGLGPRNRDAFLNAVDGMTYGDSAAQGFVRGRRFVHPALRFAFEAPPGYEIANAAQQVTMRGPGGAGIVFDGARDPGGSMADYVARRWAGELASQTRSGQLQDLRTFRVGGLEAASVVLPVQTNRGVAAAHLTAIRAGGGRIYRFFGLGPGSEIARMAQAGESFRPLSTAEAARERPWRIRVVTVRPGDSVASLAARMPFETAREERFRVLNSLAPGQQPRPGERVKLVVQ
jgi:predicted Zn-dependent protease